MELLHAGRSLQGKEGFFHMRAAHYYHTLQCLWQVSRFVQGRLSHE